VQLETRTVWALRADARVATIFEWVPLRFRARHSVYELTRTIVAAVGDGAPRAVHAVEPQRRDVDVRVAAPRRRARSLRCARWRRDPPPAARGDGGFPAVGGP